jgi:hypothetical protein
MTGPDRSRRFFLPADPGEGLPDSTIREVSQEEWEAYNSDIRRREVARDVVGNKAVPTNSWGYYDEEGELVQFLTEVLDGDLGASDPNSHWFVSNVATRDEALRQHRLTVIRLAAELGILSKEDLA